MSQISIIIPVYNAEKYLNRCIDSILNQTYGDFEVLLVDDGSPDNSGNICDEYAKKDSRIKAFHKENGGAASARNFGIEYVLNKSDSKFIAFIDSDDWVTPDYFENLYNPIEQGIDVSACYNLEVEEQTAIVPQKEEWKILTPSEFWLYDPINATVPWGKLFNKKLWTDIRFPEDRFFEDEFTLYKALFLADKMAFNPTKMYFYFQNPGSLMHSGLTFKKRIDKITAFKEELEFFKTNGSDELFKYSVNNYISCCFKHYHRVLILETSTENEKKILRKTFRQALKKYRKEIDLPVERNDILYATAFPLYTKIYLKWYALKKRFKR